MRQSSHGVTTSCAAPLTPGKKYVAVQLLTKEVLYCEVETKGKVQHVFDQVCSYLGLKDAELFGVALLVDNEYLFLDFGIKLSKLASKSWKSQSSNGLDSIGRPLLTLYLCIQFYVDCPLLVRDKQTRHHYFLQLKGNFLQHCQACSEERCFLIAAYALQADFGSFNEERHHGRYFEPRDYFPPWILTRLGEEYIIQNVPSIHKDYKSYSKGDAEMAFIREASCTDAPHNLHIYKLKKKKNDLLGSVWLGVCSRGIEIYENGGVNSRTKKLVSTFLWADIGKLCYEKKKFEIHAMSYANTRKYTYYTGIDDKSKHLLYLCKATHQFNLAIQPRVTELKRLEMEEKKSYRESYIYSDSLDLEWEQEHGPSDMSLHDFNTLSKKGKVPNDQRTSVISNASSNTTSGIVSDRVQSLDGSEDEMDSAREPESPQPPVSPTEAINPLVLTHDGSESGELCRTSTTVVVPVSRDQVKQLECRTIVQRHAAPIMVSSVDSIHSSSSDKSVSTVRSRFSLVKSCIPSVPPAFSVPYPAYSSPQHSTSASETCSSFDHSYTSSIDSTTAHMASLFCHQQPRYLADSLKSASSTEDYDWPMEGNKHYANLVPTSIPIIPFSGPGIVSSPCTPTTNISMMNLYVPPVPIRTEPSYARNIITGPARKSTPSTSPQSSNDESSLGYVPSMGVYPVPMACINGRPNVIRNGLCIPHSMQQCRTKIGVSSLSRPSNAPYGIVSAIPRQSSSSIVPQMVPNGPLRYNYYNFGAHSNLVTLGKAISVPNVINENESLPLCNSATYPPMTMPFSNRPSYYSSEALPLYPQALDAFPAGLRDSHFPTMSDYLMKEQELSNGYSESPIPPPSDFAAFIPPPPPYRNPQGAEDVESLSMANPLTPPRGFRQECQRLSRVDSFLSTSASTPMATTVTQAPTAKPRTVFTAKAQSEENLLSQVGPVRPTYIQLPLNGMPSKGNDSQELKGEIQFAAIPPPPPYGPEIPISKSTASSPSSPDDHSSTEALQQKEELPEIKNLRARGRDLNLPLITALCNDRTLMLDQQHPGTDIRRLSYCTPMTSIKTHVGGRPVSWHVDSGSSLCDYNGLLTPRNHLSTTLGGVGASILPPTPLTKWSSTNFAPKMASSPQSTPTATAAPIMTTFGSNQTSCNSRAPNVIWPSYVAASFAGQNPGVPTMIANGNMRIPGLR